MKEKNVMWNFCTQICKKEQKQMPKNDNSKKK